MIVSQVACLAHASSIQLAICVLACSSHLITPLRMVAILAHARGVVLFVDMLALSDCFPVLDSLIQCQLSFFLAQSCDCFPLCRCLYRRHRLFLIWTAIGVCLIARCRLHNLCWLILYLHHDTLYLLVCLLLLLLISFQLDGQSYWVRLLSILEELVISVDNRCLIY